MTRLIVDAALRDKLCETEDYVELCDENGQKFGFFYKMPSDKQAATIRSPFSDEEIQKRRLQKSGRPLAEILKDLGAGVWHAP